MNEQAFVMAPDQRECIQRSKFVCRILNFCVKTSHAAAAARCLHQRGRRRIRKNLQHVFSQVSKKEINDHAVQQGLLSAATAEDFVGAV